MAAIGSTAEEEGAGRSGPSGDLYGAGCLRFDFRAGPRGSHRPPAGRISKIYNRADVIGSARSASPGFPPGPRGYPILGVLPHLRSDPIRTFVDAADRYGDFVHLKAGPYHGFLASDPADIKHVLQDNARNYHKSPLYDRLRDSLGNGLLTSEDSFWLRQRRLAQPAFHRQRVLAMAEAMADCTEQMLERWDRTASRGETIDIVAEMMALTQAIIVRTMFSTDLGATAAIVNRTWPIINRRIGETFWSTKLETSLPLPANRRFWGALRELETVVYQIIADRRQTRRDESDLLSMFLAARDDETGAGMTDRQLRDEVLTMLLAGHETTSLALSWTYYLLSRHPDVDQRIADEVDRVIGGERPSFAHIDRLTSTRRTIEESLRLYPPAWGFSRRALADDEVGGYQIPKGSLVFLIPFVLHRRPKLWPNPDRFDPDRFAPEHESTRPRFAYIPFGGGPRGCIGNQFAMVEAQLIVAAVAQRYRIELVPDQDIRPEPLITLRPAPGIRAILKKRAPRGAGTLAGSAR
jgi:cytochrome P450